MMKRLFMGVMALVLCIGVWSAASSSGEGKETAKIAFVGLWKLDKVMGTPGENWKKADYPFTLKILPNGKLIILQPVPNPIYRITGTWKILADGRLQISEEEQNGKPFAEGPSISVYSIENGKLTKPAKPFVNENEKAQMGFILKKVGK